MTDVDLGVHYVRTPAGAKRYKRPIGSPIGTWPDHEKVSLKAGKPQAAEWKFDKSRAEAIATTPGAHKAATQFAEAKRKAVASVTTVGTSHKIHQAVKALPEQEKANAVRELRLAVRGQGSKKGLLTVSNQALLRVAIDPTQHPRIRKEAKRELAQRVADTAKARRLHRQAAVIALRHGEKPNHFLTVDGPELTEFQKALIKLNPRYGNAMVKLLQRAHASRAAHHVRKARDKATEKVGEHVKETGHDTVHKAINIMAVGAAGAVVDQILKMLGFDPTEAMKHVAEFVKESAT